MDENEVETLRAWVGREERKSELLTAALVERFEATVGRSLARIDGEAPLGIHWCMTQPAVAADGLGADGHPARGGFLPPVALPRRMWAGGGLSFLQPLRVGEEVHRVSRIAEIVHKQGRSGELVFVTVEHDILCADALAIRERQDIVYRAAPAPESADTGGAPPPAGTPEPRRPERSEIVEATATLLFRYSALTFNGHRIHYDLEYARQEEGYRGLVVHGPLQATLMLHMAARMMGGAAPARFEYRGVAPLVHGGSFTLNAVEGAGAIELWTAAGDGAPRMTATATA
jgi:3-methylfumaryl-CoA hydratase